MFSFLEAELFSSLFSEDDIFASVFSTVLIVIFSVFSDVSVQAERLKTKIKPVKNNANNFFINTSPFIGAGDS